MEPNSEIPWTGRAQVGSYEDREKIKDLFSRYAEAADSGDGEAWAATFTEDGWMFSPSHPSGRVTGRGDLAAMCSGNAAWLADNGVVKQRHINTNLRISVEGETAWSTSNILYFWLRPSGNTELVGIGGYRDRLRKVADEWYFESRDGYFDKDAPSMPGVEYS
jgi:3-phenylpropionate/cinnamic acid dioxygenase small subunit